jgi:hypothetical protein
MNKPVFVPPKPISKKERAGSREGTIGRFPAQDLYLPETVDSSVTNDNEKIASDSNDSTPSD